MSEKITKEKVAKMLEENICPVDGQKIQGIYVVRKGSSRYLKVLHRIDGRVVQHYIGRIDDKEALALLLKKTDFAMLIIKAIMDFSGDSFVQILNILEDYLVIADQNTREKIKRKMSEILEKMQWGKL